MNNVPCSMHIGFEILFQHMYTVPENLFHHKNTVPEIQSVPQSRLQSKLSESSPTQCQSSISPAPGLECTVLYCKLLHCTVLQGTKYRLHVSKMEFQSPVLLMKTENVPCSTHASPETQHMNTVPENLFHHKNTEILSVPQSRLQSKLFESSPTLCQSSISPVLHCTVQYCTVQYCTVLYCTPMHKVQVTSQ